LWEQGLVQADGITYFPYTFRNEIHILIENKSQEPRDIHPAQKIALFSVKQQPKMVIKWVHQIEESPWKMGSSKSFINKIKNKTPKSKKGVTYERDDIL
jgi:dUTPase